MVSGNLSVGQPTVVDDAVIAERLLIRSVDFTGWTHSYWSFTDCRLEKCQFRNLRIKDVCFGSGKETSEFVECSFDGSYIRAVVPGRARFIRCTFRDVDLARWLCHDLELIDCVFSGTLSEMTFNASVDECDIQDLGRGRNRYLRNDLSHAKLSYIGFMGGVDLRQQRLPSGSDYYVTYNVSEDVPAALKIISREQPSRVIDDVRASLEVALDYADYGQDHALFSRYEFSTGRRGEQTWNKLVSVLNGEPLS